MQWLGDDIPFSRYWRGWQSMPTGTRLLFTLLGFLAFVTVFFGVTLHSLASHRAESSTLSTASLLQGWYAEHLAQVLVAVQGGPNELEGTRGQLNTVLDALLRGGEVVIDGPSRVRMAVQAQGDAGLVALLESQQTIARQVYALSDRYIAAKAAGDPANGQLEALVALHTRARQVAGNTVAELKARSAWAARRELAWVSFVALVVVVVGVVLAISIQNDVSHGLEREIDERRRAEGLLYRAIASSPNGVVLTTPEHEIMLANSQMAALFRYPAESLEGMPLLRLFSPEEGQKLELYFARRRSLTDVEAPVREAIETVGLRADGSRFPLELAANGLQTELGVTTLLSMSDITERKRAEQTLQESEHHYRTIVESVNDLIFSLDAEGRFTFVNRASLLFFGLSPEEMAERNFREFLAPEELEEARETISEVLSGRSEIGGETTVLGANGERLHVLVNLMPIEHGGWIRGVTGTATDITARRRADERFRIAVEFHPDAILMVDEGGRIVYANARVEEVFGYVPHELVGETVEVLVPPGSRGVHGDLMQGYFEEPTARPMGHGRDLFGVRKDGTEIPVEIALMPVETGEGRFVLSSIVDISLRRQSERLLTSYSEQLERLNRDLATRNAELDEFAYAASHDLQEPLRKLATFSQWLRRDLPEDLSEDAQRDVEVIETSARRMSALIQDLLSLSRSGRATMRLERVDLNECVREALDTLSVRVSESGAEIVQRELPQVQGDHALLRQLYQNLIGNALKFTRDRSPRIEMTCEEEKAAWVLGVRDNGIGIAPEYARQIFVPFKRLHARNEYDGSGLGLSICQRIVERHEGTIWVESDAGAGAHFRFRLGKAGVTAATEAPGGANAAMAG